MLEWPSNLVYTASISPDNLYVITGSLDGVIRHWDIKTGALRLRLDVSHLAITSVALSGDGQWFAYTTEEGNLKIRHVFNQLERSPSRYEPQLFSYASFSHDSQHILVSSPYTPQIVVFEVISDFSQPQQTFTAACGGVIPNATFSPSDDLILAGCGNGNLYLWERATGRLKWSQRIVPSDLEPIEAKFSPRKNSILTCLNEINLWDIDAWRHIRRFTSSQSLTFITANFSSDGEKIIAGARDGTIVVWNTYTGQQLWESRVHQHEITSCVCSYDNRYLVTTSYDEKAVIWHLDTGQTFHILPH